MKNHVEVHIVPVWNEYESVLEPIERHKPDVVYTLEHEDADPPAHHDDLRADVHATGAEVLTVALDLFDMYDVMGSVTTLADRHPDDLVRVNVTSGTKHGAIGATIACMDEETDAQPYTVTPDAPEPAAERQTPRSVGEATALDIYPVDSPTEDQLAALAIIDACNTDTRRTKYTTIIDKGVEFDLECFRDGAEGKARYGKLRTHIVEPLESKGYIEVDAVSSKSKYVEVTPAGRQTLRAFRHRVEDVVRRLQTSNEQNVELELDDPTDTVERWTPE